MLTLMGNQFDCGRMEHEEACGPDGVGDGDFYYGNTFGDSNRTVRSGPSGTGDGPGAVYGSMIRWGANLDLEQLIVFHAGRTRRC